MISEMDTQRRMDAITAEYAGLKQIGSYEILLQEVMKPTEEYKGDVLVTLTRKQVDGTGFKAERVIGYTEPLNFISHTFDYSNQITPRTVDISPIGLSKLYFSRYGHLMVVHDDKSEEEFKVKKEHRAEVTAILKEKFGNKFNG